MTQVELRLEGKPANRNARQHWRADIATKQATRRRTAEAILTQWPTRPTFVHPVTIEIWDECRTANLRDTGNADTKTVIDEIASMLGWPGDGPAVVGKIVAYPAVKTGVDALRIRITSTDNSNGDT